MFSPIFRSCIALKQQYKTQIITEVNVKYQGNTWIKTFFLALIKSTKCWGVALSKMLH